MFERWLTRACDDDIRLRAAGDPEWVTMYHDPIIGYRHRGGPPVGVAIAFYLAPQRREIAERLFDWAARAYHWRGGGEIPRLRDPRTHALGLVLAKELGDAAAYHRLRDYAERAFEPTWDDARGEFTWGFGLGEPIPRGQLNATIMVAEVGTEGAWRRLFNRPNLAKFDEPTVSQVEYPPLGISQAWVDGGRRRLAVATYAADPTRRGMPARFAVTRLPTHDVRLIRDGTPFTEWRAEGPDAITIETTVGHHAFLIEW